MSDFAQIDANGLVLQVIVGDNSFLNEGHDWFVANLGGTWIKTSYNGKIRKNYAGKGYKYDSTRDAFIPPKTFNSWILDEVTCRWKAPVLMPVDGSHYIWDESIINWRKV